MATSNEKEFKVGDIVWDCLRHKGKGFVKHIYSVGNDIPCPVIVMFDKEVHQSYTLEGYYSTSNIIRTLYHQPYTITLQEIPEELPEVGTPVYCWDDECLSCRLGFFVGKKEKMYQVSHYFPKLGDIYTWKNISLTLPDKFK
jgi:hypothetical protein